MLYIFSLRPNARGTIGAARRRSSIWRRSWPALIAVAALSACGSEPASAPGADETRAAAAAPALATQDWRRLDDGSFARTATGVIDDRREADRCWPVDGRFDCLSLDAIAYETKAIVVATRTSPAAVADVPVAPPEFGFSCAIYPSGVIEQRLLRAEATRLQNDDIDGALWSAADVAKLSSRVAGQASPFVDCKALAAQLAGRAPDVITGADFDRRAIMLPSS